MVAGCATTPANTIDMDPVPLPVYSEGTTFVYSNGSWEKVLEANGETVTWENHRGSRSSGPVDFTFRRSRWQTRTRQGERAFAAKSDFFTEKPMSLWPLQVGNQSGYIETGRWSKDSEEEKNYTALWSCEVTGVGKVSVMAGAFDTVEIACKRYSEGSAGRLPRLREVRTYHYAPAVGHWVLSTRRYTYDRASRRTELLAVVPPESGRSERANEKMEQSFQLALEKRASGIPVSWSDGSRAAGATTAVDTFRLPGGTYCRRYVQQVFIGATNGSYYGMACRDEQGRWVVPRK
jgi:surface antigen